MKKALVFVSLFFVCSLVFGENTAPVPPAPVKPIPGSADIGGAIKNDDGDGSGHRVNVVSEKNGAVEVFLKNVTGRGATNVHLLVYISGYLLSDVRIVSDTVSSETTDTETQFLEVSRATDNNEVELSQPDYTPANPPISLPNGGVLHIEFQIQVQDPSGSENWVNLPVDTKLYVFAYWTKGKIDALRRPIFESVSYSSGDVEPFTGGLEENIKSETNDDLDTEPVDIALSIANDATTQTTVSLPDIVLASVACGYLKDGKITITNPYKLPFVFNGVSIYILPYRPQNVALPEDFEMSDVTKRYHNKLEGGGVFQDPEIISNAGLNSNNELEFTLNANGKAGVPWKAKFLKPGAFLIRGLKLKIGGGLGNIETWSANDELWIGANGEMLGGKIADKIWHKATIIADE